MVNASIAKNEPYDVVLMDCFMPVMDGPPAVKSIKDAGYTGLVVGVSGLSDEIDKQAFIQAGADGCVTKPLSIAAFRKIYSGNYLSRE